MNQLIEFFALSRYSYRIRVKISGISTSCRVQPTVSNPRSWTYLKHDSSRSSKVLSRTVQTSSLFSTDSLPQWGALNEIKKALLNGSLTPPLLKHQTRSFLTLSTRVVSEGTAFNKHISVRFRHRSIKTGNNSKEKGEEADLESEDNDSSEEEEDDGDLSHLTFPEDSEFPDNYRELKVHMKSLRLDAIVSAGLNIARSKVDDYFLESKLKLNGERILKKSKQMKPGDFVDLIMSVVDGRTRVKRVRVLKVDENKTSKEKLKVTLRAWRTAVPVDYASG